MGDVEGTREVGGEHLLPLAGGDVDGQVADADTGVVDDHVHGADVGEHAAHGLVVGDIDLDGVFGLAAAERDDLAALGAEALHRSDADAAGAAGDDHPFAC